jgi:catechol 2,3-dioxygenase-like lactoylglutathione lyase family enzyme
MSFGKPTPILRIFDEAKAREFYFDFLGFKLDWEHRFAPDMPLYMQVSKGDCLLHLSEHHGDCSPGAAMRIETDELEAFHRELNAKSYKNARPGIEDMPWGSRDMSIKDPFGNRLTFTQSNPNPAPMAGVKVSGASAGETS